MSDEASNITFKEKYNSKGITWQEKAVLISLYHTAMCMKYPTWNLQDTSLHFGVSIGLVSENIRLAKEIDNNNKKVIACLHREDALKLIDRRRYTSDRKEFTLFKDNE
jgi:hypothetical protein